MKLSMLLAKKLIASLFLMSCQTAEPAVWESRARVEPGSLELIGVCGFRTGLE
jgi:hypothetical protein